MQANIVSGKGLVETTQWSSNWFFALKLPGIWVKSPKSLSWKLKKKTLLLKPPPNNLKIAGLGNGFSVPNLYPKWCYPSLPKSCGHTLWVDVLESFKGRATYSWVLWKIRETWMEKGTSRGEFHFACGLNQPIFSGKDAVSFREDLHPRKTKNVTWK